MTIDKIIVMFASIGGIIFTHWFFLMKKEDEVVAAKENSIDIIVDGGYSPNAISVPKNTLTTVNFIRKDPSSCLEEIVIPEFKIKKYLALNKKTSIKINPTKTGTFEISCGMNMYHGKIIVT